MSEIIKNKLINGAVWSLVERFGYLSVQFISNLVLARLLSPNDFGTIGILLIFTNLSSVLVDGGLATAIIQKKIVDNKDTSTVFYTNLVLSILVYLLIYLFAPFISVYFNNGNLTLLLRVIAVIVIIDSTCSIQSALIHKAVDFKRIARIRITSAFISTIIAIFSALCGLGIWSLVLQYISYSIIRTLMLWCKPIWLPKFTYSIDSFKILFSYGYKLLLSTLIGEIYFQSQSIIIGRKFLAQDLGYYTQAKQLQQVPLSSIIKTINQVSFPVYSMIQDEKQQLRNLMRKNLKIATYVNFPLMMYLTIVANDLILFLYGE